ncbi:MAG: WD40/YVTN/BNR-like repeat-containing protein [Planctomycetota bacterium]
MHLYRHVVALSFAASLASQAPPQALNLFPNTPAYLLHLQQSGDAVHAFGNFGLEARYSRSRDGGRTLDVVDVPIANFQIHDVAVDGEWIVVSGRNNGVRAAVSADGGSTWQPTIQLGSNLCVTRLCVRGSTIALFCFDMLTGDVRLQRSTNGGVTWLAAPVLLHRPQVPVSFLASLEPRVVVDGSNVHLVWLEQDFPNATGMLQSSADGGTTWLPAARTVTPPFSFAQLVAPSMVADGSALLLAYPGYDLLRSTDGGSTWTPVAGTGIDEFQSLAWDGPIVVAAGALNGQPTATQAVNVSVDGGATWQSQPLELTTFAGFLAEASVVGSDVYVHYENFLLPGTATLIRSHDLGQTWGAESNINRFSAGARRDIFVESVLAGTWQYLAYVGLGYSLIPAGATPGTGGIVPRLAAVGTPLVGSSSFAMVIEDARGGALGVLGVSSLPSNPTPLFGGQVWLQAPILVTFLTSGTVGAAGAGSWSEPLGVPNLPALVGTSFTAQAAVVEPIASNFSLTNAVEIWVR